MTKKVIAKLTELGYHSKLQRSKELYNKLKEVSMHKALMQRSLIYGYLEALRDAKVLSDVEFRVAFTYYTL